MNIESINQNDYGSAYCLACCYLAIARYYGYNITMDDLQSGSNPIVSPEGYVNRWGEHFTRSALKSKSESGVKAAIDDGMPVIIKGRSNSYDHFVVAYDYSGSTIKVMDPYGGEYGNLGSTTLKSWSGYYVCS